MPHPVSRPLHSVLGLLSLPDSCTNWPKTVHRGDLSADLTHPEGCPEESGTKWRGNPNRGVSAALSSLPELGFFSGTLLASPALPPLGFLVVPLPGAELRHFLLPPALFLSSVPRCPRPVSLDDHFRTLVGPQLELVSGRRSGSRARRRLGPGHVHRIPETVFPRRRPGVPRSALLASSAAPSGLSPWAGSQRMHVSISAQPTSCRAPRAKQPHEQREHSPSLSGLLVLPPSLVRVDDEGAVLAVVVGSRQNPVRPIRCRRR